jgi:hypothetical protein
MYIFIMLLFNKWNYRLENELKFNKYIINCEQRLAYYELINNWKYSNGLNEIIIFILKRKFMELTLIQLRFSGSYLINAY